MAGPTTLLRHSADAIGLGGKQNAEEDLSRSLCHGGTRPWSRRDSGRERAWRRTRRRRSRRWPSRRRSPRRRPHGAAHVNRSAHVNKNVRVRENRPANKHYVVGRRYNSNIWFGHTGHRWHGRWYAYGVGPCWIYIDGLWFWNPVACPL